VVDPGGHRRVHHGAALPDLVLEGKRRYAQSAPLDAEHPVDARGGGVQRAAIIQITGDDLGSGPDQAAGGGARRIAGQRPHPPAVREQSTGHGTPLLAGGARHQDHSRRSHS